MIIGINYGHMHVGFTYPSIMSAFKNHCIELIGEHNNEFKLFTQFIWGIRIYRLDDLNKEFFAMQKILVESNKQLSNNSFEYLDDDEKEEYIKIWKNSLTFFSALDTNITFLNVFIEELEKSKKDKEEYIRIGSMAVNRPELIEEYGWDYPNKIPENIKKWK
jgi:hypothetical protein